MKVEYLNATISVTIPISVTFPEGTLEKIQKQHDEGDMKIANHYKQMLINQANMQLHILPRSCKIQKCNVKALEDPLEIPK